MLNSFNPVWAVQIPWIIVFFGSGVSPQPYKSLDLLSVTNVEQRRLPVPEPVLSNSTCYILSNILALRLDWTSDRVGICADIGTKITI